MRFIDTMKREIALCIRRYRWIHMWIGLAGSVCFFAGSAFFFAGDSEPAKTLFLAGSGGMLVGSLGEAITETLWKRSSALRDHVEKWVRR